jgi:uroporphyrinogen-III synthase
VSGPAVLILRPEPGASATAARARSLGLIPYVFPLFTVRPLAWTAPDPAQFDAVLLTSANAARHAGAGLEPFLPLPCYVVGEATAQAAAAAGFAEVRTGTADVEAVNAMMIADNVRLALHPCGRDHREVPGPGPAIVRTSVYAADAAEVLPAAAEAAMAAGAVVLVHSPRAGALLAGLAADRGQVTIAAISAAAAEAAGPGWRRVAVAPAPRDEALLELAATLCQTAAQDGSGARE